ncbi:inverse autotransporter beta domain-containing protein, partial [Candidatus Pantoea multigeneris]
FIDDWMVGYNAFYDENFSQGHKRFGIGLETWRDYLKLSANGYVRISDWKNADNVTDYQARPANGFDLRAEGWLADYPSLSARLMYEQYYGSEVALFGKDKRQKNPMAVTAGLSWTPVPMFSLSADHKAGGNQNESQFGLQMNWQFGRSLESQLDPDQVSLGATLAGNGMDLVNRNNNIVLEYRKQELVKLRLLAIDGAGTAVKPIDYQLDSKYALQEIIWNDAAIVSAGGRIDYQGNGQYTLTLPPFNLGGGNNYTLSGVAVDQHGNRSATATTTVTVGRTDVSAVNSRVKADDDSLVADGKSTTRIGIYVMDADNLPMTGVQERLKVAVREGALPETGKAGTAQVTASPGATKSASLGAITEKGNGLYEVTLTTGTRSSLAVITASLDDVRLP